jgi:phosphate starvation-inducible PhoH-like protein
MAKSRRKPESAKADSPVIEDQITARRPKLNSAQLGLFAILEEKPIAVATGCAGTGKTFAALAWSKIALARKQIEQIIYLRSPMEMGRSRVGFVPGDLKEKMAPYAVPIFAIAKKLGIPESLIQIHATGFVQGMTFEKSAIIVDEVQNLDIEEFRAIITRMGQGSRMILAGDPQQDTRNLGDMGIFLKAVENLDSVGIQHFIESHNMRHPAIMEVLGALKGL